LACLFIKDKFLTYALNILVDNDESIDEPENVEEIENFALKQEEVEPMEIEVKVELIEDMEEAVVEEIEPDLPLVIKDEPSEEIVIEEKQAREKQLRARKYQRAKMAGTKDDHCYSKFGASAEDVNPAAAGGGNDLI